MPVLGGLHLQYFRAYVSDRYTLAAERTALGCTIARYLDTATTASLIARKVEVRKPELKRQG
jgi:hypothetical protein